VASLTLIPMMCVDEDTITERDEYLLGCIKQMQAASFPFKPILDDTENTIIIDDFLELDAVLYIQYYTDYLFQQLEGLGFSRVFLKIIRKAAEHDASFIKFMSVEL